MALNKDSFVYFIYSKEQMDFKQNLAKRQGKTIKFGTVIIKGVGKMYTDICMSIENSRYPDAKVVASGVLSSFKYTKEEKI